MCVNSTSCVLFNPCDLLTSCLSCATGLHQRGGLLVRLQCCWLTNGIIRSPVPSCFPVHSPTFLSPATSSCRFFPLAAGCAVTPRPRVCPSVPAGISHEKSACRGQDGRLCQTGYSRAQPHILSSFHMQQKKWPGGVCCHIPSGGSSLLGRCERTSCEDAVVKVRSPSFRLLSICSSPLRTSSCSSQI